MNLSAFKRMNIHMSLRGAQRRSNLHRSMGMRDCFAALAMTWERPFPGFVLLEALTLLPIFAFLWFAGGPARAQVNLLPQGATRLNIQPALFHCTGVFEIADLTVTPHMAASTPLQDAVLPAGTALDWDKTSVKTVNAKRAQVSLDGIWRFTPAAEGVADPPKLGWAYIKVPGNWQDRRGGRSAFVARAGGPQWDLYDGAMVTRAWYEREVTIPAEWQGRAISLRFDRVCTDAMVYVNGKSCGTIAWPWGSVDITPAVTPGQTAQVRVLVAAIADPEKVGQFWQNALSNVTYTSARLETRGLTGSVFLESRCSEGRVTDVFVRTSTRKQNLSLDVELTGVKQAGRAEFVAEMLDEKGAVEKTFTADVAVEAKDVQTVTLSWPWANPRLWDVGQPNLYTLRLKVQGAGLDDEYDQEFGFREFWIEGRRFFLNGTEIRLRQGLLLLRTAPPGRGELLGDGTLDGGCPRRCRRLGAGPRRCGPQGIPGGRIRPQRQQIPHGFAGPAGLGGESSRGPWSGRPCGCATTATIPPW